MGEGRGIPKEVISQARKIANEHWGFIERLLNTLGVDEASISKYRFFYIEAFTHGFKHGVEAKLQRGGLKR